MGNRGRKGAVRLKELMDREQAFRKLDEETARTISVLMDIMGWNEYEESKEKYMTEEGEYDLCQAIRDMMEDSRQEGTAMGEARGTIKITENIMKNLRCSLEKVCEIAGMTLSEYQQAKAVYTEIQ